MAIIMVAIPVDFEKMALSQTLTVYEPPAEGEEREQEIPSIPQSSETLLDAPEFRESGETVEAGILPPKLKPQVTLSHMAQLVSCSITAVPEVVDRGMPFSLSWKAENLPSEHRLWLSDDKLNGGEPTPVQLEHFEQRDFPLSGKGEFFFSLWHGETQADVMFCAEVKVSTSSPEDVVVAERSVSEPNPLPTAVVHQEDSSEGRFTAFLREELKGLPNRRAVQYPGGPPIDDKYQVARMIRECRPDVFYEGACDALAEALRENEGLPITDHLSLAAYIESEEVGEVECTPELLKQGSMYRFDRETKRADPGFIRQNCYAGEKALDRQLPNGERRAFLLMGCINAANYFVAPAPLQTVVVTPLPEPLPVPEPEPAPVGACPVQRPLGEYSGYTVIFVESEQFADCLVQSGGKLCSNNSDCAQWLKGNRGRVDKDLEGKKYAVKFRKPITSVNVPADWADETPAHCKWNWHDKYRADPWL